MIIKIVTIDTSLLGWRSLKRKCKNIIKTLSTMKNVDAVEIEIISRPLLVPTVVNNRIVHSFMEGLTKELTVDGEAFVLLHMSDKQRIKFGIQPTLRGIAFNDTNFYSEGYFWADENTKRGRYNQFEETCLHEIRHLLFHRSGKKDDTHEYHDKYGTIKGGFAAIDYRDYQVGLLSKLSSWLINRIGPGRMMPLVQRKADDVVKYMAELGYTVGVLEGFRPVSKQDEYYAQGRTKPGSIITNAKGGESLHNYGVAVDIVFLENGQPSWANKHPWKKLGDVGKAHGFSWGGDWTKFNDRPHFEMTLGYTLADFQNKKVDYNKFQ